jgi:hypothetical protein
MKITPNHLLTTQSFDKKPAISNKQAESKSKATIADHFRAEDKKSLFMRNTPQPIDFSLDISSPMPEQTPEMWWNKDISESLPPLAPTTDFDLNGVEHRNLIDTLKSLAHDKNHLTVNFQYDLD